MDQAQGSEAQKKKSGALKWILMGCGGILLLGAIGLGAIAYIFYRGATSNPAEAELVATEILPIEIPAGFKGLFSMNMMGMKMAALRSGDNRSREQSVITLMTMPGGKANQEAMRKRMQENLERQGGAGFDATQLRGNETFRFRGADIQGQVRAGGARGRPGTLQYSFTLDGKNGEFILLTVSGNEEQITHEWVQNLLDSVK
jgi:hypothetical protein